MGVCAYVCIYLSPNKSKIQITNLKSKIYQKMDDSLKIILCKLLGNLTFFRLWLKNCTYIITKKKPEKSKPPKRVVLVINLPDMKSASTDGHVK